MTEGKTWFCLGHGRYSYSKIERVDGVKNGMRLTKAIQVQFKLCTFLPAERCSHIRRLVDSRQKNQTPFSIACIHDARPVILGIRLDGQSPGGIAVRDWHFLAIRCQADCQQDGREYRFTPPRHSRAAPRRGFPLEATINILHTHAVLPPSHAP